MPYSFSFPKETKTNFNLLSLAIWSFGSPMDNFGLTEGIFCYRYLT